MGIGEKADGGLEFVFTAFHIGIWYLGWEDHITWKSKDIEKKPTYTVKGVIFRY